MASDIGKGFQLLVEVWDANCVVQYSVGACTVCIFSHQYRRWVARHERIGHKRHTKVVAVRAANDADDREILRVCAGDGID